MVVLILEFILIPVVFFYLKICIDRIIGEIKEEIKMSGASSVVNKFEPAYLVAQGNEWMRELDDELELEKKLSQDSAELLSEARMQFNETKKLVTDQKAQRVAVRQALIEKIASNKAKEEQLSDYVSFINSFEYQEYCQNLRDIDALDTDIRDLLIREERIGHPPIASETTQEPAETPEPTKESQESQTCCDGACDEECVCDATCNCTCCDKSPSEVGDLNNEVIG
jgi:hypothetical protein